MMELETIKSNSRGISLIVNVLTIFAFGNKNQKNSSKNVKKRLTERLICAKMTLPAKLGAYFLRPFSPADGAIVVSASAKFFHSRRHTGRQRLRRCRYAS